MTVPVEDDEDGPVIEDNRSIKVDQFNPNPNQVNPTWANLKGPDCEIEVVSNVGQAHLFFLEGSTKVDLKIGLNIQVSQANRESCFGLGINTGEEIKSQMIIMVLSYTDYIDHTPSDCDEYLHKFSLGNCAWVPIQDIVLTPVIGNRLNSMISPMTSTFDR